MAWRIFERLLRKHPEPKQTNQPPSQRRSTELDRQRERNARQGAAPGRTRLPARFYTDEPNGPDAA